jgi:hypothetical protein
MNLREIIRESINSVLLDTIISEEILREASPRMRNQYAGNRQPNRYGGYRQQPQNLWQKKQQNVRQANQVAADKRQRANADRQERFNQWSNQWANQHLPQGNPNAGQQGNYNVAPQDGYVYNNDETQQGGYGYTDSSFQNADQSASESPAQATSTQQPQQGQQQPQQATPQQGQQQPAADFSQYAEALRNIMGASGIDPTPVENNQAAVEHISKLNPFVYAVINAIESGNINAANSAAEGGSTYTRYNPYGKDLTDIGLEGANNLVNAAGNVVDKLGSVGNGNFLQGVGSAFSRAHSQTNRDIASYLNQRRYSNAYNNTSQRTEGGTDLTYLMQSVNEGCYPRLHTEYNQINQETNGIFSAAPNVSNCHEILSNLAAAVTKYNTPQKQATQQQQTTDNTANNTNNSNNRTTNDITKNNFDWFGEEIDKYGRGIESELYGANSEENGDIQLAMNRLNKLYKKCVSSIDTKTIKMDDYVNGDNIPLTILMGLSNEDYEYDNFMKIAGDFGSTIRQNSEKYPNTAETFQLLANLHQKMVKENFKDTIHL